MYIHLYIVSDADLLQTKDCHCLAARRRARELTRLYEKHLRPHGLRATQFSILASLTLKGPTAVGELADFLSLERTTLTRSAALLEAKGWLGEEPSDDARQRLLKVTEAGGRKLASALPAWSAGQQEAETMDI